MTVRCPRIETTQTHGTGFTFSAVLTSFMGQGMNLKEVIIEAKRFVQLAIANPLNLGNGNGPTNHFVYQEADNQKADVEVS